MKKIWIGIVIVTIFFLLFWIYQKYNRNGPNVLLTTNSKTCANILDCNLLPGDILIKRQLTERTTVVANIFDMYFTHTALYIGENQIIEARGTDKNKQSEIVQNHLSFTDWVDPEIETLFVLRPTNASAEEITAAIKHAGLIAGSEEYIFGYGFNMSSSKRQYCSGLIWNIYQQAGYLTQFHKPVIFPDDLFSMATKGEYFYIVATLAGN